MTSNSPETQLRLNAFSQAMVGKGITILHQTPDHVFDLVEFLPPQWSDQSFYNKRETEVMDETIAATFRAAVETCISSQLEQNIQFELAADGTVASFEARMLPDATGVTTIMSDITQKRGQEIALAALLREVSHRSKNLLAIIQSVAMQTAHHSGGIQEFLDKFRGRLHALSSTQDLVTESDWRGSYLQPLVRSQLSRVGHTTFQGVKVTGENPLLGPNASLHIGLAIHELAANAVTHGGLADGRSGQVLVDASMFDQDDGSRALVLEWQETGMASTKPRNAPRFGTLVLERIVPLSVGGTAVLSLGSDHASYRLVVPAGQFEA